MYKTLTSAIAFYCCIIAACAQPESPSTSANAGEEKPVTIPGSHTRKMMSSAVSGQEYELQILLPAGFQGSGKTYPVVYLMDSQWDFPLLKSLYGQQYYDGFIPEIIVVGVTWGGIRPNPDSLRARDYTPSRESWAPQSGGADNFLSFINDELFPFVEKNYRGDPNNRTLMGCSLGGLITLYALFKRPEMFTGYVAASPAFGWDNEIIYQFEKAYAANKNVPHARLYMAMGGVERGVPGFELLVKQMNERRYPNLSMKTRILDNIGHSGTKAEGFARGLQYVFERPMLEWPAEKLQSFTGSYAARNGRPVEIKLEGGGLVLYFSPNNKFPLHASGENSFYSTAEFLNITFSRKDGSVDGLELHQFGGKRLLNKVK